MKWADGINVEALLKDISAARILQDGGGVSYNSFGEHEKWRSILHTAVVDPNTPAGVKSSAIRKAYASQQDLDKKTFERVYRQQVAREAENKKPYLVALPMWGEVEYVLNGFEVQGVSVSMRSDDHIAVNKIKGERAKQVLENNQAFTSVFSGVQDLKLALCRVESFSPSDAYELAISAVSQYLGSICYVNRPFGGWRIHNGLQRPLNSTLIAPHRSVHNLDGTLAYEGFWYSAWYPKDYGPPPVPDERVERVTKSAKQFTKAAEESNWSRNALLALQMYYEAFSEHEPNQSLLATWRLLELIAGGAKVRSDKLIRRAASCIEPRQHYELLGEHLRHRRNSMTHGGQYTHDDGDAIASQAKTFIAPIFQLYIMNPFKFESEEEFWRFLDLSPDRQRRDRDSYLLDCAKKFRSEPD